MSQEILGSNSSGQSSGQQTSQSGFSLLPPALQQAFTQYAGTLNNQTSNPAALTSAFTPQTLNSGSLASLSALANNAYAPTAANINSNLANITNPYMADVINPTEQAAYGANSVMNQDAATAGQFGSNRQALGANNIANQEAATIGGLEGNQFNTSLNDVLQNILPAMQTSATGSVNSGLTSQAQQLAQSTAPYSALAAYSQLLGNIPSSGGSTSQGTNNASNVSGSGFGMFGEL